MEKYLAAVRDQLEGGLPPHASQLTLGQSGMIQLCLISKFSYSPHLPIEYIFMYWRRILHTFHIAVDFLIALYGGLYGGGGGG